MDYDKVFANDLDKEFFHTGYPGKKIVNGKISLNNAKARLSKNEYYTLVTYHDGEILPEEYMPLTTLLSDDGTLFATLNPATQFFDICMNGGIQRISRLPDLNPGNPRYLLGPGPEVITLEDMVMGQYNEYLKSQTSSVRNGR